MSACLARRVPAAESAASASLPLSTASDSAASNSSSHARTAAAPSARPEAFKNSRRDAFTSPMQLREDDIRTSPCGKGGLRSLVVLVRAKQGEGFNMVAAPDV